MEGTLILRLTVAALLGGIIGFDREYRAKEAGLRTHFLVALGSALFMIVSMYGSAKGPKATPDGSRRKWLPASVSSEPVPS